MPQSQMERINLGDGSFAQFEKPLTYKSPDKINYIEHTGDPIYIAGVDPFYVYEVDAWKEETIKKIQEFDLTLAYKYAKDELIIKDNQILGWNTDRLNELNSTQLYNVYTLLNNVTKINKETPHLL